MRRASIGLAVTAATVIWASAAGARAEDFRWAGRLAAGQTLEVKGVNGAVHAQPAAGAEAEVTAVKTARKSDPASVEIKVVEHARGVTLCAVYPSTEGKPNECTAGEGGRMVTRDNDTKVEFTVHVPPGVRFVGRTVNGGITARDLPGDAEAHTVNGGVEVEGAGNVRAETVNGSIRARAGKADWTGAASFETVNGSIVLELPADTSAEIEAKTVNGGIETDFPLTVNRQVSRRRLSGTLGRGGRRLELETVNGSIQIRQAG